MKLIKNGMVVDPDWVFWSETSVIGQDTGQDIGQIVPVELFLENRKISTGIQIDVDTDIELIAPYLSDLALIVIEFAGYADGRGFSIALRLRHTFGFTGIIWASGSVICDQYAMAIQCGIDAVLVDEQLLQRQPIEHWQEALANAPTPYRYHDELAQGSVDLQKASSPLKSKGTVVKLNGRFESRQNASLPHS